MTKSTSVDTCTSGHNFTQDSYARDALTNSPDTKITNMETHYETFVNRSDQRFKTTAEKSAVTWRTWRT